MLRLGLIGTESTHADSFVRIFNHPDPASGAPRFPDVRLTALCGPAPESTARFSEDDGVEYVASRPEELIGRADAVMITSRRGSTHAAYALPFLERSIPLFLDKPITCDPAEAERLMQAARDHRALVCGGSGLKFSPSLPAIREEAAALLRAGTLRGVVMNYSADLYSEYDGFHFYAPHLIEMAQCVLDAPFGSVRALEQNGCVTVYVSGLPVPLLLCYSPDAAAAGCLLLAKGQNIYREISDDGIYLEEAEHFVRMLHTGFMEESYDALIRPVYAADAILRSLAANGAELLVGGR